MPAGDTHEIKMCCSARGHSRLTFSAEDYVMSRIASRFRGPSRRIIYALLIEVLTVVFSIAMLTLSSKSGKG
jgi:hypothetical protein